MQQNCKINNFENQNTNKFDGHFQLANDIYKGALQAKSGS